MGRELEKAGIPSPYTRQGEGQPFGYTGYRYDNISSTYFAQAREYRTASGRFIAEDVIKGNGVAPITLNRYGYCAGNSIIYTDKDGKKGYYFYDLLTFDDMREQVEDDIKQLEEYYDTEIIKCPMDTIDPENVNATIAWNAMDDSEGSIDIVVIYSQSSKNRIVTNSAGETNEYWRRADIMNLEEKQIDTLLLIGCNVGLTESHLFTEGAISEEEKALYKDSLASSFYAGNNAESIGQIIASDGQVFHGLKDGTHTMESKGDPVYHGNNFDKLLKKIYARFEKHYSTDKNDGFKKYTNIDGNLEYEIIGRDKYEGITSFLEDCGI